MITSTIKTALRIKHDKLDDEIERLEETARREMVRVGVSSEKAMDDTNYLVNQAVVTYCLMNMTEDEGLIDKYTRAWESQIDGIRRNVNV